MRPCGMARAKIVQRTVGAVRVAMTTDLLAQRLQELMVGIQVLGGHGFIREHPVEMWFRNARTLGVLEGTVTV